MKLKFKSAAMTCVASVSILGAAHAQEKVEGPEPVEGPKEAVGPRPVDGPNKVDGPEPVVGPDKTDGPDKVDGPEPVVGPDKTDGPDKVDGPEPVVGPQSSDVKKPDTANKSPEPVDTTKATEKPEEEVLSEAAKAAEAAQRMAKKDLGVGSKAPALKDITWIKGDPVTSLDEKGKLYIIECWATWCGPCLTVIPHLNEFHNKYAEEGLVIVGMNTGDQNVETAQEFVKAQGDDMSYRVAYAGDPSSDFHTNWLIPAKVTGIPFAFIVKDGEIIYTGHPGALTEDTIELMMADDFNAADYAQMQIKEEKLRTEFEQNLNALYQEHDWQGIKSLARTHEFVKGKPNAAAVISQANTFSEDWDAQAELLAEIIADKYGEDTQATKIISYSLVSPELNDKVIAVGKALEPLYATEGDPDPRDFFGRVAKSRVLFMAGKKEEAKKELKAIHEDVKEIGGEEEGAKEFLKKIEDTIKDIDKGEYPSFQ